MLPAPEIEDYMFSESYYDGISRYKLAIIYALQKSTGFSKFFSSRYFAYPILSCYLMTYVFVN